MCTSTIISIILRTHIQTPVFPEDREMKKF